MHISSYRSIQHHRHAERGLDRQRGSEVLYREPGYLQVSVRHLQPELQGWICGQLQLRQRRRVLPPWLLHRNLLNLQDIQRRGGCDLLDCERLGLLIGSQGRQAALHSQVDGKGLDLVSW